MARAVGAWAAAHGAALVIDVQDLWPETYERIWPRGLRWLNGIAFFPTVRAARKAYAMADGLVGVAKGYVDHARPWLREGAATQVVPLGVDLDTWERLVVPLDQLGMDKPAGQKWVFLSGSLTTYLDLDVTVEAMRELAGRGRRDVRLKVVGYGPRGDYLRRRAGQVGLDNVDMLGQQDDRVYMSVAASCDVGLLPIGGAARVFLPNRVFNYFAAGLPVVNLIPGELAEFLDSHEAGLTCPPTAAGVADGIEQALKRWPGADRRTGRAAWVRDFDRMAIAGRMAAFIESVAASDTGATT
jgi:glycosyltransferase involved in cell wall biosynthesis